MGKKVTVVRVVRAKVDRFPKVVRVEKTTTVVYTVGMRRISTTPATTPELRDAIVTFNTDGVAEYFDKKTGEQIHHTSVTYKNPILTKEIATAICSHIATGKSMIDAANKLNIPPYVIPLWRKNHPEFGEAIKTARKYRASHIHETQYATDICTLLDTPIHDLLSLIHI